MRVRYGKLDENNERKSVKPVTLADGRSVDVILNHNTVSFRVVESGTGVLVAADGVTGKGVLTQAARKMLVKLGATLQ
jgi:hypothetical protein